MINFSIVVATDNNNGIGLYKDEKYSIPWKCKEYKKFFKKITKGTTFGKKNVVIMGKNTYLSLPKKLSERINIIITSNHKIFKDEITFSNLDNSLNYCNSIKNKINKVFVIGGSQLYFTALKSDYLEYVYWNRININYNCNINFKLPKIFHDKYLLDESINRNNITFMKFEKKSDEINYLNILNEILEDGDERQTINSVTKSIFGKKLEFNLKDQFPIITTKKIFVRDIFEELIWFLKGKTDSKLLKNNNVNIWKENTTKEFLESRNLSYSEGDIGNMYGFQLNHAGCNYEGCDKNYNNKGFNQIEYCLNLLKTDKYSRRIIMTTFSPDKADQGVLYPCHGIVIQWYVREYNNCNYLSCHMYQRSADAFLEVPVNISSYSLLTYLICQLINSDLKYKGSKYLPDKLIISFGDLHIYESHYNDVKEQIKRNIYPFPKFKFKYMMNSISNIKWEDIQLINYQFHPTIFT